MTALSAAELAGLHEALRVERRSLATCDRLLERSSRESHCFIICNSQLRRLRALEALLERLGLPVPPSPPAGALEDPSREATCAAALAGEEAKEELYERLLDEARRVELATMYRQLQRAAREVHAPAFRRCLGRPRSRGARCG